MQTAKGQIRLHINVQPDLRPCCFLLWLHNSYTFNSFLRLLIDFANSLDPDQGRQNISLFVWFDSLRPINNLSVKKGWVFLGWTSTKLGLMCLAQGHSVMMPVRLEPAAPRSRVKHSTTELLHSHAVLIWIQTVWHSNSVPGHSNSVTERIFWKT